MLVLKEIDMYSKFLKTVVCPLYWHSQGCSNLRAELKQLEQTQWFSSEEIQKLQWKKLAELLEYSFDNVPYYKNVFKMAGLSPSDIKTPADFRKLPLLSKQDIMKSSTDIVSAEYSTKDLSLNSTGGSTGVNLAFFNDKKRASNELATGLRSNSWAGLDIGCKSAYLWGSAFDLSRQKRLGNRVGNFALRTLFLSSYNLSVKNMAVYARKLSQHRPKVIVAYPSPLYWFAKFLRDNGINDIRPQSVICSAETLYDFQRELIESVFHCPVFNRYGCREFGAIAVECSEHSGLHINAEHVYLECLKNNGEPSSPGEIGELVITDLDNHGMPFIRYRIGDMGTLSDKKCRCSRGLPLLGKIEGRTFDVVVGANGRALGGTFWTLLLRTSVAGIEQFQVTQETTKHITVRLVTSSLFKSEYIDSLEGKIKEYCGNDMQVRFHIVDKIPQGKSGKFRFVISKVASTSRHA